MVKALRMQEKAAQVGFDWPNKTQVWAKVKEELLEFEQAKSTQNREQELGDLFFAMINYARFENINPDDALEYTNRKFKKRFEYIEQQATTAGKSLTELSLSEMDVWWNESKTYFK
jgi:XTP/dITP diphosphohydrolase